MYLASHSAARFAYIALVLASVWDAPSLASGTTGYRRSWAR